MRNIKQAIEGVFLQKTNFSVELIDSADYIIKQTIKNAPENMGMMENHLSALS